MKRITQVLFFNILLTLVLLEVVLRISPWCLPDAARTLIEESYRQTFSNLRCFHEPGDLLGFFSCKILLPPKEKKEILVLGDSFAFGQFVKAENTFPAIIQSMTRKTVVNMAIPDTIPLQYNRLLEVGMRYNPDIILYCITANDIFDSHHLHGCLPDSELSLDYTYTKLASDDHLYIDSLRWPDHISRFLKKITNLSRSYQLLKGIVYQYALLRIGFAEYLEVIELDGRNLYVIPRWVEATLNWNDDRVQKGLAVVIRDTRQAYRFAVQNSKYFLVVLIPPKETVYHSFLPRPASTGLSDPFAPFKRAMQATGIPTLDATPSLRAHVKHHPTESVYCYADIHLNETGHRIVADDIVRHIRALSPLTGDEEEAPSPSRSF